MWSTDHGPHTFTTKVTQTIHTCKKSYMSYVTLSWPHICPILICKYVLSLLASYPLSAFGHFNINQIIVILSYNKLQNEKHKILRATCNLSKSQPFLCTGRAIKCMVMDMQRNCSKLQEVVIGYIYIKLTG